jgi:hypothetical protein
MPEESLESWKQGYAELLECDYDNWIDTYFTVLLPNSEMASMASRMKYGIRSVTVYNYFTYNPSDYSADVPEETAEMICATDTMSLEDMIEAYVYAWVINTMHINGYSNLTARYCRAIHGISYRTFYESMQERLHDIDSPLRSLVASLIDNTDCLLRTGRVLSEPEHGITHHFFLGQLDVYHDREQAFEFGFKVARQFGALPDSLIDLQKNLVITEQQPTTWTIDSDLDIETWQTLDSNRTYRIIKKYPEFTPTYYNVVFGRRQGWLKNRIKLVA